jgi:hypothetical protein
VSDQWTVTYRDGKTKLVECDEMKVDGGWAGFFWADGQLALLVALTEVRSIEPYVEPPF